MIGNEFKLPDIFIMIYAYIKVLWETVVQYVHEHGDDTSVVIIYSATALIAGIILKRYLRSLFIGLLLSVFFIGVLHYTQVVTIDGNKFNALVGFNTQESLEAYFTFIVAWMRAHLWITISAFVSFVIGYRLG